MDPYHLGFASLVVRIMALLLFITRYYKEGRIMSYDVAIPHE